MNDLVSVNKDTVVTSSRIVAKVFEKNHNHVLRDIRNLIYNLGSIQNWTHLFQENIYIHEQNKQEYMEYLMTKDGFTLLAMGFTGAKAVEWKLKYIQAFNQMEMQLQGQLDSYMIDDPIQRAKAWIKEQEHREQLEQKIQLQEPKVLAYDCLMDKGKDLDFGATAKAFDIEGLGRNNLMRLLRDKNVLMKNNNPYQKYIDIGYFRIIVIENEYCPTKTLVTTKGLQWLAGKLVEWGYLANVSQNVN